MPRDHALTDDELVQALIARKKFKTVKEGAAYLGISDRQLRRRVNAAYAKDVKPDEKSVFAIDHVPEFGTAGPHIWEIQSNKGNKFRFGAFGDLHAASKYTRWDVREDLMKRAEDFGAIAILDTGNWIDGERGFNRYDLEVSGMTAQLDCLAQRYPKVSIPTYAVTGADHEGWYIKSEGIDIGRHCEQVMVDAGHKWFNLGYVEADILLRNHNSGKTSVLRLAHPSGGSAYALSYQPQKIIESYEGAEKPAVVLFGHFHKLEAGNVRNVWYVQTGCQQDQTPFLRGRHIEAHVGGVLLEMEQDPETGAIISLKPDMIRYFNSGYYFAEGKSNRRWSASGPIRQVPREVNR